MRAALVTQYGPWRDLRVGNLAEPVAGDDELLLEVEASEVNFPDILHVEGRYQVKVPLPFAPGLGGVGRVLSAGSAVGDFTVGQRVLALPVHGMHAERVAVKADHCFAVPDDVPSDIAAALGLVYQTSWFGLFARADFRPADRVLVLGASGGIGMATIQLARALGALQVIAATRGAEGARVARELGADAVVDTAAPDLRDSLRAHVLELTDGHGADVVIDPVGGPVAEAALRAMAWEGRYVVIGFAAGDIPSFRANYLLVKNISVSGLQWTDYRKRDLARVRDAQERIFGLWREGRLKPRISSKLPLSRIHDAFEALEQGAARGKIVLVPDRLWDGGTA
ncbi:MAG: NADPH:quinone oxidoreductase [Stappia sp.]|uniref:NADPH:quinone oxidoreductase family protein n=1 Tax=Stappia sp. TaxID=1870903 RepID=UPI000C5E133F|nr:NADPH:quinone oxidoreductase family protein [Stappia sp.]MBM22405.1 NADPH:quinone oxidoreductase [Stappia sp.]